MTAVFIISILLFLVYAVLLMYYRQSWLSIPPFNFSVRGASPTTRISVIIPARNEEQNISACLDSLCAQSYAKHLFEVIVVNDHSTDRTVELVNGYASQNIKCIDLADYIDSTLNAYKKKAIEVAIQQSTGDLIVTTDADCILQVNWLQTIAAFYEAYQPAFIAAPVLINCSNGFIEKFQALDFMVLQGITGASVHKKIHSMCNGANLAYEKTAFEEVGGFKDIDNIASGDDMLLMHKIYKLYPDRVLFLKSKDAIVQTAPVKTIRQFFDQRIRWASKASLFDDKRIFTVLLLVYLFNLVLILLPIISLFNHTTLLIINLPTGQAGYQLSIIQLWLWLLFLKTLLELFFLFPVASFFGKQNMLKIFPVMQPFHIIYTVIAGFLGKFGTYTWKDRKVK